MTKEVEKRYSRVHGGLFHEAIVTIRLDEGEKGSGVTVRCTAPPTTPPQGHIEDVPENGYRHWQRGAALGAEYALEVAGEQCRNVIVSRIQGLTTDTNPTVVGVAAALGVWEAVGYEPTPEQLGHIKQHAGGSWRRPEPSDALPDFHSLPERLDP